MMSVMGFSFRPLGSLIDAIIITCQSEVANNFCEIFCCGQDVLRPLARLPNLVGHLVAPDKGGWPRHEHGSWGRWTGSRICVCMCMYMCMYASASVSPNAKEARTGQQSVGVAWEAVRTEESPRNGLYGAYKGKGKGRRSSQRPTIGSIRPF